MAKAIEKKEEKTTINPERKKALDVALAQIDKQFGKGSAMKFGQRPVEANCQYAERQNYQN